MQRPDYVKCVKQTHPEKNELTWCEKPIQTAGWTFDSIDHAAYTLKNGRSMAICEDCAFAIRTLLHTKEIPPMPEPVSTWTF